MTNLINTQTALVSVERRIRAHMNGVYREALEVGRCLVEAKEQNLVPHGQWEKWLNDVAGMNERSAQRLMQAAREVPEGSVLGTLPLTKIQAILALPEPEREAMAQRAQDEGLTVRRLQEEVKKANRRFDALSAKEAEARAAADSARAALENRERELNERIADLGRQLRTAKKPAAVPDPADKAEIARLRRELNEAQAFADDQAEKRREAQRALIEATAGGKPGREAPAAFGAADLYAAVQEFLSRAGALPHLSAAQVAAYTPEELDRLRSDLWLLRNWCDAAEKRLNTVPGVIA